MFLTHSYNERMATSIKAAAEGLGSGVRRFVGHEAP